MRMSGWHCVVVGVVERDDNVLLVRQQGPNGEEGWSFPGGIVEDGETLAEALRREFLEETGLSVEAERLLWTVEGHLPGFRGLTFVFAANCESEAGPEVCDPDDIVK